MIMAKGRKAGNEVYLTYSWSVAESLVVLLLLLFAGYISLKKKEKKGELWRAGESGFISWEMWGAIRYRGKDTQLRGASPGQ